MMNKIVKIFILIFISFGIANGYDQKYEVDLWSMGDLRFYSPYNFYDVNIQNDNTEVYISYMGFDCEQDNDFSVYINGLQEIGCRGGNNGRGSIESGKYVLNQGVYEIYTKYNRDNNYRIGNVIIGLVNPSSSGSGSGVTIGNGDVKNNINIKNSSIGDINDFFDSQSFYDFMIVQLGLYFLAVMVLFFFKVLYIFKKRLYD